MPKALIAGLAAVGLLAIAACGSQAQPPAAPGTSSSPTQPGGSRASTPPGLSQANELMTGCKLQYNDSGEPSGATVTLYNNSGQDVTVSALRITWGSNGIVLTTSDIQYSNTLSPGDIVSLPISPAPLSATSCETSWAP